MKNNYFCLFILILLILQSCAFEPKGVAFVTVDPTGKTPVMQINLNLATDTLFIPTNTTVTFAYGLNGEKINWAQFNVNGALSNQINIEPNMVSLSRPFNEIAGTTFSLEMKIFFKSQTGSMADVVGAEGYLFSRKWTIVMMSISQLASRITKADFVDGSFKIEFEKFKGMVFTDYKIYKSMPNSQKGNFLLATINSREQTSYIDTTYCGEESIYYILTNDTYQGTVYWIKGPIPILTSENTANSAILFKWTKPPYYKNLKGYRISYRDISGNAQQMAEIPDATTESFNYPNPIFAHSYKLYLTPLGKSDNYYNADNLLYYLSTSASATLGQPVPKYYNALTGQGSMIYFIDQTRQITLFDPLNFTTARQLKYSEGIYNFGVSLNDKYLVSIGYIPKKIYFEDLSDATKSKSIDISASVTATVNNISISNAGTGILMTNNKGVLYDYINERKLAEVNLTGSLSYSNKISASGNFFYLDSYSNYVCYQYKDNQTILLESGINQGVDVVLDCYFIPGIYEKMVRVYHNRIEVLDCNTWTIEKKWLFPNPISHVYNFDIKSGKLLFSQTIKMVVFDVINGTQEELATTDNSVYNMTAFFYSNGYLFWGEGTAYKKN